MSETKFKEAKGKLAFSQSLLEKVRPPLQQNMVQPQGEMAQDTPQAPTEQPQQTSTDNGVEQAVQKAMEPYMKEIKDLITKEPQEVALKIEGEMKPTQDDNGITKT